MFEVTKCYSTAEGNVVKLLEQDPKTKVLTGVFTKVGEFQGALLNKPHRWGVDGRWSNSSSAKSCHDLKPGVVDVKPDAKK